MPRPRRTSVVLAVVGALVLLSGVGVVVAVERLEGNVRRTDVFGSLDPSARPSAASTEGLTILVLGSDDREDDPIGRSIADPEGGYHDSGKRADTTLLVRLPADRSRAWVVSVPRDSWVLLPPCTTETGEQLPEREGQFGLAFREGGLPCTVRAVEALTDVRVDHTVVVDFTGFVDMVSALDGVPVCLDEPFRPREVDLRLDAGRHVLRDRAALEYVRARYGVDDGSDLARIERQKSFMSSMVQRARSRDLVLRPDKLLRFASAATRSLEVDEDLDVRGVALSVRGIEPQDVLFTTVPLDPDPGPRFEPGGALAGRVKWDDAAAAQLFADLERDRFPQPPAPATSAAPSPGATGPVSTAADRPCA